MTYSKSLLICAALAMAGCASASYDNSDDDADGIAAFAGDIRLGEEARQICFSRTIDGFTMTGDDTVVLEKGVNEEYIVEVFPGCAPLPNAQRIGIDSATSCVSKGDDLIVSRSVFSNKADPFDTQRCSIREIYEWNSNAEEELAEDMDGA